MQNKIVLDADFELEHIHAGTTLRAQHLTANNADFSLSPRDCLNMALHVGDESLRVRNNRNFIGQKLQFPSEPYWLDQVHSNTIIEVKSRESMKHTEAGCRGFNQNHKIPQADASYTYAKQRVLAIMSADCLPLIFAAEDNSWIAVAHCGWRSLAAGIIQKLVATSPVNNDSIRVWMGPAISQRHFQVGEDVRQVFRAEFADEELLENCFKMERGVKPNSNSSANGKYLADLYGLAKGQLAQLGIIKVKGGDRCTFSEKACFFSYRREVVTGRMLSFIWMD